MVKIAVTCWILLAATCGFAQGDEGTNDAYIHKGLIRAQSTISVGQMFDLGITPLYLHGDLEYYAQQHFSVRGDVYLYFNNLQKEPGIDQYAATFTGALWHPAKNGQLDPYLGFQPGGGVLQYTDPESDRTFRRFVPLASLTAGFNYYGPKWFHLFANTRFITGRYADPTQAFSMNELRFSFGLGLNIN